jgi:uncharacterized protein with PQ loop repeat
MGFLLLMNQTLANAAVIGASVLTVVFLLPQIVKLIRTGNSNGVSATWPALGFVTNIGWLAYMISQGFWAAIIAPLVTFISYGVILWALARNGRNLRTSYVRGMVWTGLLVAITLMAGGSALGVFLGFSYGVQLAPSIWAAFQTADLSGISPGTWGIGLAEALLWGYFGWYHTDLGIVIFGIVGVVGSGLMLIRYYATRRTLQMAT